MTATKNAEPDQTDTDEDVEVEEFAVDETPLATSQAANLTRVIAQSEDERQGIYGQVIQ
jgi:hypothetical protein